MVMQLGSIVRSSAIKGHNNYTTEQQKSGGGLWANRKSVIGWLECTERMISMLLAAALIPLTYRCRARNPRIIAYNKIQWRGREAHRISVVCYYEMCLLKNEKKKEAR